MAETQCSAQVIYDSWCHTHQCEKRAKVTRNGKPYCTIHDPEYIAKKDAEGTAKYYAKSTSERAKRELVSTAVSACKAINPDNPMAVAESISDLYEALKEITAQFKKVEPLYFKDNEIIGRAEQALTKTEGGG